MSRVCLAVCLVAIALLPAGRSQAAVDARIESAANTLEPQVIAWRRDIHEHPELSNREFRTSELVARHLESLGMEVTTGVAHTGVVGVLRGGQPGPVIALRADMDGLPVTEQTGLAFASTVRSTYNDQDVGVMHACGHDNHVAILMGAATVLTSMKSQLPGTVKFIFQPAEEGAPRGEEGGARMMIDEGVLEKPAVDAVFGLHISQGDAVGQASYRPRGAMASAQRFDITITGRQTHAARPWAGVDPLVVGAHIITALQTIVSRQVDITRAPAVVTVGTFHGGVRNNIVPDTATMSGTIRTFDADMRRQIHQKILQIAINIGESMGATVEVEIDPGVPVTYNDPALTEAMLPTLQKVYGDEGVRFADRITGAEDFSFFQEQVPGFFFFIGGRSEDVPVEESVPNHSPLFTADERALVPGVKAMSQLAYDYLLLESR
jgi:amidohydrolase